MTSSWSPLSRRRRGTAIESDFRPAASGKSDSTATSTTIGSIRKWRAMAAAFLRRAGRYTDFRRPRRWWFRRTAWWYLLRDSRGERDHLLPSFWDGWGGGSSPW